MRGLSKKTEELVSFAHGVLVRSNPMTLRQLHYAIFSASVIDYANTKADYCRLSRATTAARRLYRRYELAGLGDLDTCDCIIPPAWIVDELREAELISMWDDVSGYMDTVRDSYRRNNWQDQPNHVEVWSEKATVLGSMRPVTREFGVMLRACRGFGSTGMEAQIGYLFEDIQKPITVFYLGDHDPSGHDIERDIHHRAQRASGKGFEMIRLAIHREDIKKFKLPPQTIKVTDSRAASFQREFGPTAPTVELDALPVDELRRRARVAITDLIDVDLWNRQIDIQQVELDCIRRFATTVKNLPQVPGSAPQGGAENP